jgi:hypothetical protein
MEILISGANEQGVMIWDLEYHKLWLRVSSQGMIVVEGSAIVDHSMFVVDGVDVL